MSDKRLLATVSSQPQAFGDSIAALQASLLPLMPRTQPAGLVLLFASALPFEGKSTTVAALAASIGKSGGRVLVIDADLRAPTMHHSFGVARNSGLADLLTPMLISIPLSNATPSTGFSYCRQAAVVPDPLMSSVRLVCMPRSKTGAVRSISFSSTRLRF